MISSAKNLEPEYKYLTVSLRLEQQRLYNWSVETGLQSYIDGNARTEDLNLLGLNRLTVADTMAQIHSLTTDFIRYKNKFGILVPDEFEQAEQETVIQNSDDSSMSNFPDLMEFFQRQQHRVHLMKGLPKRLKWAAFYKEKYEGLISRLRGFNDALVDLVDSDARIAIRQSTRETNTTILHLHSRIDDLLILVQALLSDESASLHLNTGAAAQCGGDHCTQEKLDLARLAVFKAVNTSIENDLHIPIAGLQARGAAQARKLALSAIHLLGELNGIDNRCEAEYQPDDWRSSRRVWIEWREYDPLMQAQSMLNPSRVDKLVALLSDVSKPDLLRVPRCVGYFDSPRSKDNKQQSDRLGFVFEKPSPWSAGPISLKALIMLQTMPLLTERIALAKAVATCLMSLHSVNWLHKGIRSQNVLFFPRDDGSIEYSCPYLSGFGYARPAFREDMTEMISEDPEADMYRHPSTHGLGPWEGRQGFKRTFDIYSLGLVLIEIATWRCIDVLLEIKDPKSMGSSALKDIRRRLLSEKCHLDSVGASAGARFRRATQNCLDSAAALGVHHLDNEMDVQVAAKVSRKFYHQILLPLEEIQT